jgi:hypothetical protein
MTKTARWALACAGILLLCSATIAGAQEKTHKYIGVDKCAMCHKTEAKGNQHGQWLKTTHAKAFETLAGEKAKAIAAEKKLAKPPQESPECLKCHVTGYGKPAEAFEATFKKEQGVGCESCHGPGSDYKVLATMKDRKLAVAAGLVIPDEKTCTQCHNAESPSFTSFDYKAMVAKIAHPNPAKKS